MTATQDKLTRKIENALMMLIYDGHDEYAAKLSPVLEAIYDKNYVLAVIFAEINFLPDNFTRYLRRVFKVKLVS